MNRRTFLKSAVAGAVVLGTTSVCYGFAEAGNVQIVRKTVTLPNLPKAFDGTTVAFLTDIHHGPYVSLDFVASVVRATKMLQPDLIIHGGDYILRSAEYTRPCFEVFSALRAPLGVYGVLGNHDHWHALQTTQEAMRASGITELTNCGVWLTKGNSRLRLCGVDDLMRGEPTIVPALGDTTVNDACILVSHNPDFAETIRDTRVGLVLSGHTHGGQVNVPNMRNPFIPSQYGDKYRAGLCDAPATRVYVSRGLGVTGIPVRYNCPPELTLLTLRAA